MGLSGSLSAFQAPGFKWIWLNSLFMGIAFTVEALGQGWLVLQLTDSPFWVGVAAGLRGGSEFLCSFLGGALADRFNSRTLLLVTQIAAAILNALLAVLVFTHYVQLWQVLLFVCIAGGLVAISQPSSRALEFDVVGVKRLLNASALRFMGFGVVQILGALAGGFTIDRIGVGGNYALSSGAVVVAACSILLLKVPVGIKGIREPFVSAVKSGLKYSIENAKVRRLLLLSLMTEFLGFSYMSMTPVIAKDVLEVGATGLGYLSAMKGVGMLIATLSLAALGDFRAKGRLLFFSTLGFGLFIVLFGLSPWFTLSLILVALLSGCGSIYDSTMATLLQLAVSGEMRGRVMGLYVSTWGLNQVGAFGLGAIGTLRSVPVALAISGGSLALYTSRLLKFMRQFNTTQTPA